MDEREKTRRARARVAAMMGFYIHAAVFVVVMIGLFALDALAGKSWWVQWPLIGWGLGLAAHALAVFGSTPRPVRNWQLRKIRSLREQM